MTVTIAASPPEPSADGRSLTLSVRIATDRPRFYLELPMGAGPNALVPKTGFGKLTFILAERAPVCVTVDRTNHLLSFQNETDQPLDLRLQIGNLANADLGLIRLPLQDEDGRELAATSVAIARVERPRSLAITRLSPSASRLVAGSRLDIAWAIDTDSDKDIQLAWSPEPERIKFGPKGKLSGVATFRARRLGSGRLQDYRLAAKTEDVKEEARVVSVQVVDHNGLFYYQPAARVPGVDTFDLDVLGLFTHPKNGRLYLLGRNRAETEARLWWSDHGFAEAGWTLLPGTFPLKVARRPGAIVGNILWLVGGDACNAKFKACYGNTCQGYDLDTGEFIKDVVFDKEMAPRLGHAVLAVGDNLWVMGGLDRDSKKGLNDVWAMRPDRTWDHRPNAPWTGRLAFAAAATASAVWVFGGFSQPLGASFGDLWHCDLRTGEWKCRGNPLGRDTEKDRATTSGTLFCAGVLFPPDPHSGDSIYCLAETYHATEKLFRRSYQLVRNDGGTWVRSDLGLVQNSPHDVFCGKVYYRLGGTVFGKSVMLWALTTDAAASDKIVYLTNPSVSAP
ncbi:MAG: hypothetical protein HY985_16200 [Magnetospirillum sp.]|nr:hypothetical protein [Magnetospirillum sp.]